MIGTGKKLKVMTVWLCFADTQTPPYMQCSTIVFCRLKACHSQQDVSVFHPFQNTWDRMESHHLPENRAAHETSFLLLTLSPSQVRPLAVQDATSVGKFRLFRLPVPRFFCIDQCYRAS